MLPLVAGLTTEEMEERAVLAEGVASMASR